ncbi:Gfo/Idh/MocA family oxidoreductase [Halosquirtibacter laminarini]|uniref:Gfo/Idh/MocA family oxidoreductase n=1 Tax=Halosquirtibacter laminarini TaxID=3374600 RepID=A0AC61NC73_9BACT|nr:Gfo/Idh/MocA family oxidoreductase [Prolixibacteraceae bacterium]
MNTNKKIRWGIIGCGNVTEKKSGPAFNKVPNSELVAVMRRDSVKLKDYAQRHHVPLTFTNASDLIHCDQVDAVYIATPPHLHAKYAIEAMKAGKPAYVEKPMAATLEECVEMNQVSMETGVPLFVAYYRRALPGFLKVKSLIESGEIGKPMRVYVELFQHHSSEKYSEELPWRVIPEMAGAGLFYDLGSHTLDYLVYLFGPILKVGGRAENVRKLHEAEERVHGAFCFENGVEGEGRWMFDANYEDFSDKIVITCERGEIHMSTFQFTPIQIVKDGKVVETMDYPRPEHVQQNLIQTVVSALLGEGNCPSTGMSAMNTNWAMWSMVKQYYTDKK